MDFTFTEEQQMVIDGARRFATEKLDPVAEEYDAKQEVNIEALKELGELGYLGMTVPEDYDGSDLGSVAYAGAMIELSKADPGVSVVLIFKITETLFQVAIPENPEIISFQSLPNALNGGLKIVW